MLYDGAIKFCRQAVRAMTQQQFEESYNSLMRAQKIVLELSTSLKHEIDPELCGRLAALYTFIYRRLVDANVDREVPPIEEAIRLLSFQRETWLMLMRKTDGDAGAAGTSAPTSVIEGGSFSQSA